MKAAGGFGGVGGEGRTGEIFMIAAGPFVRDGIKHLVGNAHIPIIILHGEAEQAAVFLRVGLPNTVAGENFIINTDDQRHIGDGGAVPVPEYGFEHLIHPSMGQKAREIVPFFMIGFEERYVKACAGRKNENTVNFFRKDRTEGSYNGKE